MTTRMMYKALDDLSESRIKPGTRVLIIGHGRYRQDLHNRLGTVRWCFVSDRVGVLVDGIRNERSEYGWFYFDIDELEIVSDADDINDIMEDKTMAISNINGYLNVVRVKFNPEEKPCNHLYANFEPDLQVGDLVVVKPAIHDATVAIVEEIITGDNFTVQREVVAKVDTTAYENRVAVRKQAAELKAKMEERARQLQDVVLYKTLAESDSDMKALLDEYLALVK